MHGGAKGSGGQLGNRNALKHGRHTTEAVARQREVEGAGAAAYAAVVEHKDRFAGRNVGIVLSGGNIDMRLLSNVILRELSREGRILSLEVMIEDRPGLLARIASLVGEAGGNILEVSHNRMMTDTPVKSAYLGMVVEARDATHAEEIRACLRDAGFTLRTPG